MVKLLISRSIREGWEGRTLVHVEGMSNDVMVKLPLVVRYRLSTEHIGDEIRYYLVFGSEEEAALFKLTHL
jgi:hypothetical protein